MYARLLTNHPLVNILFGVVVVMGLVSFLLMPREQDPEVNFNWVQINTVLPGASALDVEKLVTSPLEDAIGNVQDDQVLPFYIFQGLDSDAHDSVVMHVTLVRPIDVLFDDVFAHGLRNEIGDIPALAHAPANVAGTDIQRRHLAMHDFTRTVVL